MAEILRMNLCVGFEDLQNLAGKEGEEEARRALPSLRKWFSSPDSRQAMWHAGQIVFATRLPNARELRARMRDIWLRDFFAVALYHASLAFWAYGLLARAFTSERPFDGPAERLTRGNSFSRIGSSSATGGSAAIEEIFYVDADPRTVSAGEKHRFINLARGIPVLTGEQGQSDEIVITDSKQVMDAIMTVMLNSCSFTNQNSTRRDVQRPAMVENLIQLMHDLGQAASAV